MSVGRFDPDGRYVLVENIPSRPLVRRHTRQIGDIQDADSPVDILHQAQRAAIVAAAKRKAQLLKTDFTNLMEVTLVDEVYRAFDNFFSEWRIRISDEDELVLRAIENIDSALAALVGPTTHWSLDGEDAEHVAPPFSDEDSAFQWLQDSLTGIDNEIITPDEFFDADGLSREVHHLWLARRYLVTQHERLYATVELDYDLQLTPKIYTTSRLTRNIQQLIADLCEAWLRVDPKMGLTDANNSPDNPLLRYLDACLSVVLADQRPSKKTVLDFVKRQWKPKYWRKVEEPTLPFPPR